MEDDAPVWEDPALTKDLIGETLGQDRRATDGSLHRERRVTDQVLEELVERKVDEALERSRERVDEDVERSRQLLDARLRASAQALPAAAETLESAADALATVAEHLSDVSPKVEKVLDTLDGLAQSLSEVAGGSAPEPPSEAGAPAVLERLADVAESLGEVAQRVAEERESADHSLRIERELLDRTLEKERLKSDQTIELERKERRFVVSVERRRTDHLLSAERQDTDEAVDHAFDLLMAEQLGRAEAEHRVVSRDELLAIVSHDLRAPLDVIGLNAALMASHAPEGEHRAQVLKWAGNIERAVESMDHLLSDLLDVARFEGGGFRVALQLQDVVHVVAECLDTFTPMAERAGLHVETDLPAVAVPAAYDRDRLRQVLGNLLRNAIQFTPAGGSILVGLVPLDDGCRIAISDTGCGIPEAHLTGIFGRFQQLRAADRHGLGLGLYISKQIVEAHHGQIWVESQVGRGSTFFVRLGRDTAN